MGGTSGGTMATGGVATGGGFSGAAGTGGSSACELDPDASPCSVCMADACCVELTACAETTCPELTSCIADCENDACFTVCEQAYPDGIEPLNVLFECASIACPAECE
jgi:hypothetical protein